MFLNAENGFVFC